MYPEAALHNNKKNFFFPSFEEAPQEQYAARNAAVTKLEVVASELGCTLGQLAIAWAAHNPRVSTVITGASRMSQLQENLGALAVLDKLTPAVLEKIDAATLSLAE